MAVRYDRRSSLARARRTPQGYVRVDAYLARVGIQTYRNADGSLRRELRHPDDVFAEQALEVAQAPVTVGHPGELLTPDNTRLHRVGAVSGQARRDGGYVAAEVLLDDARAIARVDAGELVELSAGYTVDLDETPGVWEGQPYDARQTHIVLNHVALLPAGAGRAGSEVRLRLDSADAVIADMKTIRIDGKDFEVSDEVFAHFATLTDKLATSEKQAGALEVKLAASDKARTDALDPAALDARVAERVALESAARQILGKDYSAQGKSARQVHEDAVKFVRKDDKADLSKLSDERLLGQFEALVAAPSPTASAPAAFAQAFAQAPAGTRSDASDALDPDVEYKAMIARRNAGPEKK